MLKDKKLALFFSKGVSLRIWDRIGSINREIRPYNELAKYFKEIYFITYGDKSELNYKKLLAENIKILFRKFPISAEFYQFLIPFVYLLKLRKVDIYKTNQMVSVVPALILKILYKKPLVLRCGYEWFLNSQRVGSSFLKLKIIFLIEKNCL